MEMNEFIWTLQEFIDAEYPDLMIEVTVVNPNVATGFIHMWSYFNIKKSKFKNVNVIKTRIKEMLYTMRDKLNNDIERIEDAETS